MAFFFSGLRYDNVMFAGAREGVSRQNKPYMTITVVDSEGNTNTLSTSEPETMAAIRQCAIGDRLDLRITCAGGPQKQYAMLSRGADSVSPAASDALGY